MRFIVFAAAAVVLSGCAEFPVLQAGADPGDPGARVPPTRYTPVTAGTVDYRPVEPKSWIEQNQRVAPRTGGKQ
jgi:hypothetical protein